MIARMWKGWTSKDNADNYERFVSDVIFPGLKKINGYLGGYIFRKNGETECEFVITNLFESLEAVKEFAGKNYETAVIEPEARRLLSKAEPLATHYEVKKDSKL